MIISAFTLLVACGEQEDKLIIATAANLQYAIPELEKEFEARTGIPCEVVIGSSGKLFMQIREGAPFDVFLSADQQYPYRLYRDARAALPVCYAVGQLAAYFPDSTHVLSKDSRVAIPNPRFAPYGRAAREVSIKLGADSSNWILAQSVAQVNQFAESGSVDVAFTSLSTWDSGKLSGAGRWEKIDQNLYHPLMHFAAVVSRGEQKKDAAQAFIEYIQSPVAHRILRKHGYAIL